MGPTTSNKKGVMGLNLIPPLVAALVIGFVFLSVSSQVMTNIGDNNAGANCITDVATGDLGANCSASFNMSHAGNLGLAEFNSFGATLGLISAAIAVLVFLAIGLGRLLF